MVFNSSQDSCLLRALSLRPGKDGGWCQPGVRAGCGERTCPPGGGQHSGMRREEEAALALIHRCLQPCLDIASSAYMSRGPSTSGNTGLGPPKEPGLMALPCRPHQTHPHVQGSLHQGSLARLIHRHYLKGRLGANIPALGAPVPRDTPTLCNLPTGVGSRLGVLRGMKDLAQTPGTD